MNRSFLRLLPWIAFAACAATGGARPAEPRGAAEMEAAASRASRAIGLGASDFSIPDADGKPVRLADLRAKWVVLYFYPRDDTPGCVCEATEFTDLLWQFLEVGAEVVGISPDSPESHREFAHKYGLEIRLLSDPGLGVMRQYGAWVEVPAGPARGGRVVRSTYLVDPKGRIAWHWPEVIPQGHAARVKRKLDELRAAASK